MWGRAEVAYQAHNLVVVGSNPTPQLITEKVVMQDFTIRVNVRSQRGALTQLV